MNHEWMNGWHFQSQPIVIKLWVTIIFMFLMKKGESGNKYKNTLFQASWIHNIQVGTPLEMVEGILLDWESTLFFDERCSREGAFDSWTYSDVQKQICLVVFFHSLSRWWNTPLDSSVTLPKVYSSTISNYPK